ncbi:MAG: hypothetical protein ACOY4K_13510 [Pseudomonadota bacterium]
MTSPQQGRRRRRWLGAGLAAVVVGAAGGAAAGALDLYYERTLMGAADARCDLFDPVVGAALEAGRVQARGAALRAGASAETLQAAEARALARGRAVDCASPDVATAASRVRSAFAGYARMPRMTYPGDLSEWRADRTVSLEKPLWRLSQTVSFGWDRMIFGLGGRDRRGVLLASASFADGASPYAVRLVMRDPARAAAPYLDRRQAGTDGRIPLPGRLPPAYAQRSWSAEARSPASPRLAPGRARDALLVRFPADAADALAALDPREAVMVEFLFAGQGGEGVRRAWVEVGDFAAGRAFLAI